MDTEDEFIWRFELKPPPEDSNITDGDPVVGFVRTALRELLDFVVLTRGGQEVKVDGFMLMGRRRNYNIFDSDS